MKSERELYLFKAITYILFIFTISCASAPPLSLLEGISYISGSEGCNDIVSGEGAIWCLKNSSILKIDPKSALVVTEIKIGNPGSNHLNTSIAVGEGAIWISHSSLYVKRIDPINNRVVAEIDIPTLGWWVLYGIPRLAIGEGYVWGVGAGSFFKINPNNNEITKIEIEQYADEIFVASGSVWLMNIYENFIYRLNPKNHELESKIILGANINLKQEARARLHGRVFASSAGKIWILVGKKNQERVHKAISGNLLRRTLGNVDPENNIVVSYIDIDISEVDASAFDIASENEKLLISFWSNRFAEINTENGTIRQKISLTLKDTTVGPVYLTVYDGSVFCSIPGEGVFKVPLSKM